MRFLVDQGLSPEVARELRALGHDAVHVMDIGFETALDSAILARAIIVRRILDVAEQSGSGLAAGAIVSVDAVRHRISYGTNREGFQ